MGVTRNYLLNKNKNKYFCMLIGSRLGGLGALKSLAYCAQVKPTVKAGFGIRQALSYLWTVALLQHG